MSNDLFGLPERPVEIDKEQFPWLHDEEPAPGTEEGQQAAPEGQQQAPEQTQASEAGTEQTPEQQPGGTEVPQGEFPQLILGKYKTPEAAYEGYRQLQDLQRRTAQRASTYEEENEMLRQQGELLEDTLQKALPFIQQLQSQLAQQQAWAQQQGLDLGQIAPPTPQLTPEQVMPYVDQMVAERFSTLQQDIAAQREAERYANEAQQALTQFFSSHPEVQVRGPIDDGMQETVRALNERWSNIDGMEVDLADPEALEYIYEATQRPYLRQVLELNPQWFDSNTGMDMARAQASLLEGQPVTRQTTNLPASQVAVPGQAMSQSAPVVERATTANPQTQGRPLDIWEEAVVAFEDSRKKRGQNVFGL